MPAKWAVLVVHGVGDTGPGVTVDNFIATIDPKRDRLKPDGQVEVHRFPDSNTPAGSPAPLDLKLFPIHLRRATVCPGPGSPPDEPREAIFAEVYWADLSSIREGKLNLLLGLFSTVFSLRYLADQAAIMPTATENSTRGEVFARGWARWLRFFLSLSAWVLCGPIAALSAFFAVVLAGDYLILLPILAPTSKARVEYGFLLLSILAALAGGVASWSCIRARSSCTWTRFCYSLCGVGVISAGLVALHLFLPSWDPSWLRLTFPIGRSLAASPTFQPDAVTPGAIPWHAPVLLSILDLAFAGLCLLMLAALLCGLVSYVFAPNSWRAGLCASYGAAVLQVGLWLLIIPPLALVGVHGVLKDDGVNIILRDVWMGFLLHFAFALIVVITVSCVWLSRKRWLDRKREDFRNHEPPFGREIIQPGISRLIVHDAILRVMIALAACGTSLTLIGFLLDLLSALSILSINGNIYHIILTLLFPGHIASTFVPILLVVLSPWIFKGLRDWLHVLTDIINHFYRPTDRIPLPWGEESLTSIKEFEIQQNIEHRFRTALEFLLDDPETTHLTVVSHSQGTVIALDVLSIGGNADPEFDAYLKERASRLKEAHFITMGSPITHLYQHYFPYRYPSLCDPVWEGMERTIKHWVNIYRVDDYIGAGVEERPGWRNARGDAVLKNYAIGRGGHVGYWRQPNVFDFPQARDSLPGGDRPPGPSEQGPGPGGQVVVAGPQGQVDGPAGEVAGVAVEAVVEQGLGGVQGEGGVGVPVQEVAVDQRCGVGPAGPGEDLGAPGRELPAIPPVVGGVVEGPGPVEVAEGGVGVVVGEGPADQGGEQRGHVDADHRGGPAAGQGLGKSGGPPVVAQRVGRGVGVGQGEVVERGGVEPVEPGGAHRGGVGRVDGPGVDRVQAEAAPEAVEGVALIQEGGRRPGPELLAEADDRLQPGAGGRVARPGRQACGDRREPEEPVAGAEDPGGLVIPLDRRSVEPGPGLLVDPGRDPEGPDGGVQERQG